MRQPENSLVDHSMCFEVKRRFGYTAVREVETELS